MKRVISDFYTIFSPMNRKNQLIFRVGLSLSSMQLLLHATIGHERDSITVYDVEGYLTAKLHMCLRR